MKKIDRTELKKIQLDILKFIDYICRKNNIKYFVNYGTLLGAVRHKGFIPWDDDIDISMYREDYSKLINAIKEENSEQYDILSYENSDWYFNNFLVVIDKTTVIPDNFKKRRKDTSVFVDVFPIDRFNDPSIFKKIKLYNFLRRCSQYKKEYIINNDTKLKDFCRTVIWYILYFSNPKYFAKKIENIIQNHTNNNGEFEAFLGMGDVKEIFKAGTFDELIELDFEDLKISAPKNYDYILKNLYGDYMKLPAEEERTSPHEFEAYYK